MRTSLRLPDPTLVDLTLDPTAVISSEPSEGTVILSGPAPAGGAVLSLSSSKVQTATVPPNVTIASGAKGAKFQVTTIAGFEGPVAIQASYEGVTRTANLEIIVPL